MQWSDARRLLVTRLRPQEFLTYGDRLLKRYREYASTEEAFAVLFVKQHLTQAGGHWIDVVDFRRYEMSPENMHFRFVIGGLYKKKIQSRYPPRSVYAKNGKFDERRYYLMTRAITWEAAHAGIEQQKAKKVQPLKFEVTDVSYNRNRDNRNFFRDDAPPEMKSLANNLHDRMNPLWDKDMQYVNGPEFVYRVRKAKVLSNGV